MINVPSYCYIHNVHVMKLIRCSEYILVTDTVYCLTLIISLHHFGMESIPKVIKHL